MITNTGSQIITKFLLGQASNYASYIAIGVGAKPLGLTENDDSSPTKKSMDFEAFRRPVISKGLVSDNITLNITAFIYTPGPATPYGVIGALVVTEGTSNVKLGDEVELSFTSSSMSNVNGTYNVIATKGSNQFYIDYDGVGTFSWAPSSGNTGTVTYLKERMLFKAELPSDQKYEMSEIALFSSESNSLALSYDSKILYGFLPTEGWTYFNGTNSTSGIDTITNSLADTSGNITSSTFIDSTGTNVPALFVNSDNTAFDYKVGTQFPRKSRQEVPRLYNRSLIVRGNLSNFSDDSMNVSGVPYLSTSQQNFDLKNYSTDDYIKLAFSIISNSGSTATSPYRIRIRLEFLNVDNTTISKAVVKEIINNLDSANRYVVLSKKFEDFTLDSGFSWSRVNQIRVYAQTINSVGAWDNSYISFDGLRVDNENTVNPLYGMVAYSRIRNQQYENFTITKGENTPGYIEFRLGLGIT